MRLDASDLQGSSLNLLNELGSNTLLVSGMDRVDRGPTAANTGFSGRVLFTSEATDGLVQSMVPPLRVPEPTWATGCVTS